MSVAISETLAISELLPPDQPAVWPERGYETLFSLARKDYEPLQLAALQRRFALLKGSVAALAKLVEQQGVTRIDSFADALPVFFDHRVLKNYPANWIETRNFPKLTAWLNKLTTHDLTKVDLTGVTTLDGWMTRLDEFGMIIGHSTGTTGKLSLIPRSRTEFPAWFKSYNEGFRAATGVDGTKDFLPTFGATYRGGHQMSMKQQTLFTIPAAGGPEHLHTMYPTPISSDLLALAARMQDAENRGELDELGLDPALVEKRQQMVEQGRRREQDMQAWYEKVIAEFRGKRVRIGGTHADITRVAMAGLAEGLKCDFAPGSVLMTGGGMKGFANPPENWKALVQEFTGIDKMSAVAGMSEWMGIAPLCDHGHYHYMPSVITMILDENTNPLPREGVQTGRLALFDLLAETYWGGFISGDQVTMHWDDDCGCGWKGPYIEDNITRFANMEGGDDKISCAGSAKAYDEFMEYLMEVS